MTGAISFEFLERRDLFSGVSKVKIKNFAPVTLANSVVRCTIKHGAGLLAARGKYSVYFAANGNYQLCGGKGVADSFGGWEYTKTDNLTGSATFDDSNVGLVGTETLTFKSAHTATFLIVATDGSFQSGTLTL